MDRRARVASIVAITATLASGGAAVATTTAAFDAASQSGAPGKAQLIDDTKPPSATVGQPASNQAPGAVDPGSESSVPGRTLVVAPPRAPAATLSAGGSTSSEQGRSAAEPEGRESGPTPAPSTAPPSTSTPVVGDPPPSTAPGTVGCNGSDDGMTEAQKQAREAACHREGDDD